MFFLELNARIQVEHPVTEEVTGLDLVEWQLRIAAGEPLATECCKPPLGHAIEARLYAEDPVTFLPQSGRIEQLVLPSNVRVDAGVEAGDEIGTGYDPMIAKLVARGATRDDGARRAGAGARGNRGRRSRDQPPLPALARLAPRVPRRRRVDRLPRGAPAALRPTATDRRPARSADAWRLNLPAPPPAPPPDLEAAAQERRAGGSGGVTAPMPGTVIAIHVSPGDAVAPRQPLVTLEAMKMEHPVTAPFAATVAAVHVGVGDAVVAGASLVELWASVPAASRSPRLSSQPTTTFTSQTTIVAPTYVQKPSIEKSGAIHSASASIATLIAK